MVSFCDYLFFGAVETTRFGHKYVSDPSLAEEERIDSAYKLGFPDVFLLVLNVSPFVVVVSGTIPVVRP